MNIEQVQNELLEKVLGKLKEAETLPKGSEEQARVLDSAAKLYDVALKYEKMDRETSWQETTHLEEVENDKKFKLLKNIVDIASCIGIPVAGFIFDAFWMRKGFMFEELGTYTSKTFQLFNRFRHRRSER